MRQVDCLVKVKDDSLTHRELIDLDSETKMSIKERCALSHSIRDLHQERLLKYAKKRNLSVHSATIEIERLHSEGVNIASHISYIIGVMHYDYMMRLKALHENSWFIR
jgi:phosphatidylinositol kinase/protein kinase (PI-3  family)